MVNIRKLHEKWDRQAAWREQRMQTLTQKEKDDYEAKQAKKWAELSAIRECVDPKYGMTALECAQAEMKELPRGSLAWCLAEAQTQGDIWCGLDWDVTQEQERQAKMRSRYGKGWSGRIKLSRFRDNSVEGKNVHAWRTVRWLEKRGFVTVGDGYVTWVGPTE